MSSDVTKRALSAGLGVGALAVLAPRASADTPFSSFAFPATGAPTARTMPDRLAETKNVKDFGAGGNGSTDDTAAIQAAFDTRGVIFFPPGRYRVSQPISFASGTQHSSIRVFGHHAFVSGNFPGYVFDRPSSSATGTDSGELIFFEGLSIMNGGGGGCIRLSSSIVGGVHKCSLVGFRPLTLVNMLSVSVRDCRFQSMPGAVRAGAIGAFVWAQQCVIDNCDFNGFYHAVRNQQATIVMNSRFEMNHFGFVSGMGEDGGSYTAGFELAGTGFEANDTAIWVLNGGGLNSIVRCVSIQGQPYAWQANETPGNTHYGLKIDGSTNMVVQSVSTGGTFDTAAISIDNPVRTTFIGVTADKNNGSGVLWQKPTSSNLTFIQCNQP
jgi:Pectate lyase superfamily protein